MTMYGTCTGMSLGSADGDGESEESYPCFDLLMFAEIAEE